MKYIFITRCGKDGYGHLFRCKAISQAFSEVGIEYNFIVNSKIDHLNLINNRKLYCFDWYKDKKKLFNILRDEKNIILDTLSIKKNLFNEIKKNAKNFVYIDDYKRWKHNKGVIIDWTINQRKKPNSKNVKFLHGKEYAALRKPFWDLKKRKLRKQIKRLFVSFSNDKNNLLPTVITEIRKVFPEQTLEIVITSKTLLSRIRKDNKTNININLTDKRIKNLMLKSDLAIAAGGQTLYELAATGTPSIAIVSNENQFEDTYGFENIKFLKNCGNWRSKDFISNLYKYLDQLKSYEARSKMSKIGQNAIDGNGARRIAQFIKENTK